MKVKFGWPRDAATTLRRVVVLALVTVILTGTASGFTLSKGQECVIVIPRKPSMTEEFAANELCRYFARITNSKDVAVKREDGQRIQDKCIYVGTTDPSREPAKQLAGKDMESFVVSVHDDKIILAGNCDRATLYAVYTLLEQLGCRWLAPGIDHVPQQERIAIATGCQMHSPGMKYRVLRYIKTSTSSESEIQCTDWAVKNKINMITERKLETQFSREIMQRGSVRGINNTHISGYILTNELYKKHPEVFARDTNGKAVLSAHSQQFCFSAPQAISVYADTIGKYINVHPDVELFPITQADGTRFCQCSDCLKLYGKMTLYDESSGISGQPNVTKAWMSFVNKTAEKITRNRPGKKFYTLAYSSASDPAGMDFEMNKSVIVVYVHSISLFDQFHEYQKSLSKHRFLDLYKKWSESVPGGVGVYDYYPFSKYRSLPLVAIEKVSSDIRAVHALNCPYFELQSGTSPGMYLPVYYAGARTMWNPALNLRKEMELFYNGMYGSAATHVERFFQVLEKARERYPHPYKHDTRPTDLADVLSYLTKEVVDEAETLMEKARTAAAGSRETQERLQPIVDHFNYAKYLRRGRDAFSVFKTTGDVKFLTEAVNCGNEIKRLAEEAEKSGGARRALGMIRSGILNSGRSGVGYELGSWKSVRQ
ncbi:MAG: DUF4838 domain-containing protein [Verrucomicrobia bacterium]|nr:DUF4838 domain-containing protein [Verrucomicrobiota bacterium]